MDASASFSTDQNSEEQASTHLLNTYGGEIIQAKARCHTNTISVSRFARPIFTPNFIHGLQAMEYAANSNNLLTRMTTMRAFLQEFGTHYNVRARKSNDSLL